MHPETEELLQEKLDGVNALVHNQDSLVKEQVMLFERMTAIEDKIARAEKLARDVELILAGFCLGLYIAVLLSH